MENFNLEEYLSNGVENVVSEIMRATIHNPKESMFMAKYVMDSRNARRLRKKSEKKGEHIPPFLIASITTRCNLHCKGCYARANHNCHDDESRNSQMLDTARWGTIFKEAEEMGIGFILLAGGEPFLRRDVLQEASKHTRIIFPVFTNGTMLLEEEIALLDKSRNLIPVLSIEGDQDITDARRGEGTYQKLMQSMQQLQAKGIVFAASVTVTKDNKNVVLGDDFIDTLEGMGCKGVIYVEYVPVDASTKLLALDDETRNDMMQQLNTLRRKKQEMVFIAFPGDEKSSGGCLAAGRGFFHINAMGGAEPCPFSPYSDVNLKNMTLKEALKSPLFQKLQENGNLKKEHIGGCVLFEQEEQVKQLLKGES